MFPLRCTAPAYGTAVARTKGCAAPQEPRPQPAPGSGPRQVQSSGREAQPARDTRQSESRFGTIAVRVQPSDATVLVDGEEWTGPEGPGSLLIDLGEGSHDLEIRKQGFSTYRTTVRVRGGETVALNVSRAR